MNKVSRANGLLQIDITSNNSTITLPGPLPRQSLKFEKWRIQFSNTTEALSLGRVYLELPWLSPSSVYSNNNNNRLLLLLDNAQVSVRTPYLHIDAFEEIPQVFTVRLVDVNGTPISNLSNAQFQFSYDYVFNR
jgi:hypothetical protein